MGGTNKNILIIDDEETIRLLLKEMLIPLGYVATTAADKEEALQQINTTTFDLIFVDIFYAHADYTGFDIIDIIQQTLPHCQVVVLTSQPSMDSAVQALRCRVLDYLEKPISLDVLTAITKTAFDHNMTYEQSVKTKRLANNPLTQRETEILEFLAKGFSYAEASEHLNCKVSTLQWHIKNIYRKMNVSSKSEAIYEALCMNIITLH